MPQDPTDDDKTQHYIEMWKQTISVQQHFNDISWRIRGLALTAMTFTLGTAAVTSRERTEVTLFSLSLKFPTLILFFGLILWLAFYFVDKSWYHRLLIGSVKHGETLETELRRMLPKAGLTHQISASSPSPLPEYFHNSWPYKQAIHSTGKLRIFYWMGVLILVAFATGIQLSS
ncbi:hypothetical protein [Nocardiopsis lambiniae]|uniref:DUF202 domain-containing protein n=1 Tax=Nocardiopsis lambiniae TaxID=3075539 RepID=A0ABU2M961_9ACTN|nr:hypothetical protein [Nocardiopsis sp. DSM 44743]MDT0329206.1 hypothetical protein [Nocardiopsis sp. DSM 44743]